MCVIRFVFCDAMAGLSHPINRKPVDGNNYIKITIDCKGLYRPNSRVAIKNGLCNGTGLYPVFSTHTFMHC